MTKVLTSIYIKVYICTRITKQNINSKFKKTMENLINSANDTYLVSFQNSINKQIICEWDQIQVALRMLNDRYILADIFRFDPSKKTFKKVPLKNYNLLFGNNTEAIEILKKYKLIK